MIKPAEKVEPMQLIVELIRTNSEDAKLTRYDQLIKAVEGLSIDEVRTKVDELMGIDAYQDICEIAGKNDTYLFSSKYVTINYAKFLARIEDQDLLTLVAETVRDESRLYPRPTDIRLFSKAPFKLTGEQLSTVLAQMKPVETFADIQESVASNGAVYLYSTKYLSKDHAQGLTEWIEVLQHENP